MKFKDWLEDAHNNTKLSHMQRAIELFEEYIELLKRKMLIIERELSIKEEFKRIGIDDIR